MRDWRKNRSKPKPPVTQPQLEVVPGDSRPKIEPPFMSQYTPESEVELEQKQPKRKGKPTANTLENLLATHVESLLGSEISFKISLDLPQDSTLKILGKEWKTTGTITIDTTVDVPKEKELSEEDTVTN